MKAQASPPAGGRAWLTDVTERVGVDFVHQAGATDGYLLPEITGSGVALFDLEGDGDLDLYWVDSGRLEDDGSTPSGDRLLRNQLVESGRLRFEDVSAASELPNREDGRSYGMGVASGDFDRDGRTDLLVTAMGHNHLLRNQGDGTLRDISAEAGIGGSDWTVSASFFDADGDGWLDLYLGNYVDWNLNRQQPCYGDSGEIDYCGPIAYPPQANRLLRNRGDGTFEDASARAGILAATGPTLGVVAGDFDRDGRTDLYVANDQAPNQLWRNRGDGTFEDIALFAGCAVDGEGQPQASMGIGVADVDGDGDLDLLLTHLRNESHTFYANDGAATFRDATAATALGAASWPMTGFGTGFFDLDHDGWLDLFVANGSVKVVEAQAARGDRYPLREPNQLFRNQGAGTFEAIRGPSAAAWEVAAVSRGVALGDLDNDGDTDLVVSNSQGPAQILRNDVGQDNTWLGLRVREALAMGNAIGAKVVITPAGSARAQTRRVATDGSYASAHDPRLQIGLGGATHADVAVTWPDGRIESWSHLAANRYHELVRGTGQESVAESSTESATEAEPVGP